MAGRRAIGLALAVVVAACSGSTPRASPSDAPVATAAITAQPTLEPTSTPTDQPPTASPVAGTVHVEVPANWDRVVMTKAGLDAAIEKVSASNQLQAVQFQAIEAAGTYDKFLFYGIDYVKDVAVGAANLTVLPLGTTTFDALVSGLQAEMGQVGATNIKTGHTTMLGINATTISFQLTLAKVSYTAHLVLIPAGPLVYEWAATCTTAVTACLTQADAMAKGLTVGP